MIYSKEVWRNIPEYEGVYQASNLGRIKSLSRETWNGRGSFRLKERILKDARNSKGYINVVLYANRNSKIIGVHQLVAMAFLDHKRDGHKKVVDHIDNNKSNNLLENLQIITHRENSSKDKKRMYSKYTGVTFSKTSKKWCSVIRVGLDNIYLGTFECEKEAHNAYNSKLLSLNE